MVYNIFRLIFNLKKRNNDINTVHRQEKSESRERRSLYAGKSLQKITRICPKENLQNNDHIPIQTKFTRDYRRDSAIKMGKDLEEQRKMIKYRDPRRSEVENYLDLNNKLIEKSNNNRPPRDVRSARKLSDVKDVKSRINIQEDKQKMKRDKMVEKNNIFTRIENDNIIRSKSRSCAN